METNLHLESITITNGNRGINPHLCFQQGNSDILRENIPEIEQCFSKSKEEIDGLRWYCRLDSQTWEMQCVNCSTNDDWTTHCEEMSN